MFSVVKVLLAITIFLWLFWIWSRRHYYLMWHRIGGPVALPILGCGYYFLDKKKLFKYMEDGMRKYNGNWIGFLGTMPCFVTAEPKVIEEILTNELFIDKMDIYSVINDFLREGLFTSTYKKWSHSRKHINKAFTHNVLVSFYPIFNSQVRELCGVIDNYVGKGEFNIYHYIAMVQLDTSCITTMGINTNFLKGNNTELLHAFTTAINITSDRLFNPFIANNFMFRNFSSKSSKLFKSLDIINSNAARLFEDRLAQIENAQRLNQDQDSSPEDEMNIKKSKSIFIDIMVREYMSGNFTWEEAQAEINTMILAAYETTTNVLFMSLMFLAMYPQYQEKLYEEIISVISDDDDVQITHEHVQQLVYIELIMNETMRLISPVPLVGRNASQDYKLKNGMFIAKGTNIIIDIFNLHHNENIWGPGANHIFNPDNFLKDNFSKVHPYSFIPFTKGLRNCIGWRYATISYKILLAHIIKRYKISTTFKFKDLIYTEEIVIKFKDNPNISFELRKKLTNQY